MTINMSDFILLNTSVWDAKFQSAPAQEEQSQSTETVEQPVENTNTEETQTTTEATQEEENQEAQTTDEEDKSNSTEQEPVEENYPNAGEFLKWGEWLKNKLEENAKLEQGKKQPEQKILDSFFEKFFKTNWTGNAGTNLVEIFKDDRARVIFLKDGNQVRLDCFDPTKFAFLQFLTGDFAKDIISQGKLSKKNFLGLVKSCATKQRVVPDSELVKQNDYNLIYCPALYDNESNALFSYLAAQKSVFSDYSKEEQIKNKRAFIYLKNKSTATEISQLSDSFFDGLKMPEIGKLNTLELAKTVLGLSTKDTSDTETGTGEKLTDPELETLLKSLEGSVNIDADMLNKLENNKAARTAFVNALLNKIKAVQAAN
jgi:hypothetical protein